MSGKFRTMLGWYLPPRYRRWYIYLPLDLLGALFLCIAVVLIGASTISPAPFYDDEGVGEDVERHLKHLADVVAQPRLDIYSGYSPLCGRHAEWGPIFYMFYGMSLTELLAREPARREEVLDQLHQCARDILYVPKELSDQEMLPHLRARKVAPGALMNGYVGVVLGLRKAATGDDLFDVVLAPVVEALALKIGADCEQANAVWTSDQATQLYAIWLYDQTTGADHSALFDQWLALMRERFLEPETGLLVSHVGVNPDQFLSPPRGSSLTWTSIFLADVMPEFAREQYDLMCRYRAQRLFSMAAVTEYEKGNLLRFSDPDSGPLVFGFSPSATGFALGTHKLFGEPADFARVYRVFELFGRPQRTEDATSYYLANAMGDAILLYAKVALARDVEIRK